jgi:nucleotide-binding universal stress UspA family protein
MSESTVADRPPAGPRARGGGERQRSVAPSRRSRRGSDLANTFDARLTVLHVVRPLRYRFGRLAPTLPIIERLDDPLANPVLLDARQIAWVRGVNPRAILIAGDPGRVIVTVASDLRADLLVIGTKPRLLPGRLAARLGPWVSAHATCPVLPVSSTPPKPTRPALDPVLVT